MTVKKTFQAELNKTADVESLFIFAGVSVRELIAGLLALPQDAIISEIVPQAMSKYELRF